MQSTLEPKNLPEAASEDFELIPARGGSTESVKTVTSIPQNGDDEDNRATFTCGKCGITHLWNRTTWVFFLPEALPDNYFSLSHPFLQGK